MALVVYGRPVRILKIKPFQFNYLFYGTVQFEEAVGGGSAEFVGDESLGGVVDRHVASADGHDAGSVSADGHAVLGEHDADGAVCRDDFVVRRVVIGRVVDGVDQIPGAGTQNQ